MKRFRHLRTRPAAGERANVRRVAAVCLALMVGFASLPSEAATPQDGPIDGFLTQVPLGQALPDMAPAGVHVIAADGVDTSKLISWKGGDSWQGSLAAAVKPLGLVVSYDDDGAMIAPPPVPVWSTVLKLPLRAQIQKFLDQANQEGDGCGAPPLRRCWTLMDPPPDQPREPWKVQILDQYQGDLLGALTWLRDGFQETPKPDIQVTDNNVVSLHFLGEP